MPETIGGATYSLDLDAGKFHAGAQQADGDFKKLKASGDAVTKSTAGMSSTLGGIGRTAAAVALGMGGLNLAVTGVKAALTGTIQAAAEDAASQARLQAAVAATGASYARYADQLDAVIKKGQERGFSDDQTRSGLSILIAQTDSVTEATKRYAIAQDLARGANIDVVTASRLLGKITEENVTALQRYGITVKAGASETEALAQVQAKFAGQADAFAKSTAGQFARTSDAIHEAGESIGRVLLPSVAAASVAIADASGHVEDLAGSLGGLGGKAGDLFPSLVTGALALAAALVALKIAEGGYVAATLLADLATGGLGVALSSTVGRLALFTAGIVAADLAIKALTGQSIAEHFSQADEKVRGSTAALKDYNDALLVVQRTVGNMNLESNVGAFAAAIQRQLDAVKKANEDVASSPALKIGGHVIIDFSPSLSNESQKAINKQSEMKAGLDALIEQLPKFAAAQRDPIAALEALRLQLSLIPGALDVVGPKLDDLEAQFNATSSSVVATAKAIRDARSEFDKGLQLATGELDRPNPVVEELKVSLLLLEQEKRHLEDIGDVKGVERIDAQIASLNNRIAETAAPAEIAQQALRAWGAAAVTAAGDNEDAVRKVIQQVTDLGDQLTHLPTEAAIKLSLLDPEHIRDLISALAAGLSFDVAINLVSGSAAQVQKNLGEAWAGSTPGSQQSRAASAIAANQASDNFSKWMEEVKRQEDAAANSAQNFAKGANAAGDAATQAAADSQIWADGIISLGEAIDEGLTPAQAAGLEMMHDAETATWSLADAQFRLAVEQDKTAHATDSLQIGLVAIAAELIRSGRTAEEFRLDELLRPAFENVKSMIDEIFSKPTREDLQLHLQRDQLERRKLLLEREGADASKVGKKDGHATREDRELKKVNDQLEALDREIELRRIDNDITKTQLELKDQTLQTDQDVANAAQFLGTALQTITGDMESLQDVLGVRVFDAGLRAAAALNAVGAAGGSGFTAEEKHWINGVARSKGEPEPFPGFLRGTLRVGETGPALLHRDEVVLPPVVGSMFRNMLSTWKQLPTPKLLTAGLAAPSITVNLYGIQDENAILRRVDRTLRDALRVTKYGGSSPSSSASR